MIQPDHRDTGANRPLAAATDAKASKIWPRVASSLVLAPIALAAAYAGGWIFSGLWAVSAAIILWEWTRLVTGRADLRALVPGLAATLVALWLTGLDRPAGAASAIIIGAVVAGLAATVSQYAGARPISAMWAAGGVLYAGSAFLGPSLLRRDAQFGLLVILFLAAVVWSTDSLAFFVGRAIGGPLLAPKISPHKTWAGALGGLVGALIGGISIACVGGLNAFVMLGLIAVGLSAVAQAGDLFESAVKRRFGAKDASHLIPGHGGLMDRLDGFLVAALAALVIGILREGMDAPARGLLLW